MAEPYYTTATAVRTELNVNSTTLPDADAISLIQTAEDLVDELIGARAIDTISGRKVAQADVESWQWTKLGRATTLMAAAIYDDPSLKRGREWYTVSGPDFRVSRPLGSEIPRHVEVVLNQSGLRVPINSVSLAGPRDWESRVIGNRNLNLP